MNSRLLITRRTMLVAAAAGAMGVDVPAATAEGSLNPLDPLLRIAALRKHAESSVLISVACAGKRVVAVGESGIVVTSDDNGVTWKQSKVPVSVTLTSVFFVDDNVGWVVGHSGVVLGSKDSGSTWTKLLDGRAFAQLPHVANANLSVGGSASTEHGANDPLLDVWFFDHDHGLAVGAFGLFLRTRDGGKHWEHWNHGVPNADGNHLYAVRAVGNLLYVVGERGSVFASSDRGESFKQLELPYEGSFFGVTGAPDARTVIFGLQGRAFIRESKAEEWTPVVSPAASAWTGAAVMLDQRLVLVGQNGSVLVENRRSGEFSMVAAKHPPISAAVQAPNGTLVTVGPRGVNLIANVGAKNLGQHP